MLEKNKRFLKLRIVKKRKIIGLHSCWIDFTVLYIILFNVMLILKRKPLTFIFNCHFKESLYF